MTRITVSTALVLDVPAGPVAHDVMIAVVVVTPPSATIGTPAGWTNIESAVEYGEVVSCLLLPCGHAPIRSELSLNRLSA